MFDCEREMTSKKSCKYGEHGSFEQLLFLYSTLKDHDRHSRPKGCDIFNPLAIILLEWNEVTKPFAIVDYVRQMNTKEFFIMANMICLSICRSCLSKLFIVFDGISCAAATHWCVEVPVSFTEQNEYWTERTLLRWFFYYPNEYHMDLRNTRVCPTSRPAGRLSCVAKL